MADKPESGDGESLTAIFAAIIGNLLIAATNFVAAAFTGSSVMISEAIAESEKSSKQPKVLTIYLGPDEVSAILEL